MPGINGIEVLKHIKAEYSDIRVVMLTNDTNLEYKQLCMGLGADHFLDKSTEFDRITEIVKSIQRTIPVN